MNFFPSSSERFIFALLQKLLRNTFVAIVLTLFYVFIWFKTNTFFAILYNNNHITRGDQVQLGF